MNISIRIALAVFIALPLSAPSHAEHPFLILKRDMYADLRARAASSPWKEMKADALLRAAKRPMGIGSINSDTLIAYLGAASLAYILDTSKAGQYKNDIIKTLEDDLEFVPVNAALYEEEVPPASLVCVATIALDIIYDDLTAAQRTHAEANLYTMVLQLMEGTHPLAIVGMNTVWGVYKGTIRGAYDPYHKLVFDSSLTSSGIFFQGPGYAHWRFEEDRRLAKSIAMDVLEFTGFDKRYYRNPALQSFYQWLYTLADNPAQHHVTFGNTSISHQGPFGMMSRRAGKFGAKVLQASAWYNRERTYTQGHIIPYVLWDAPFPAKVEPPVSQVYPDGGGFFREANASRDGLYGALWNPTRELGHGHKEANAIYLAGYGEHLLVNAGYGGWRKDVLNYTWEYINQTDSSGNTLWTSHHAGKKGGGIEEGFINPALDYACGLSGPSLVSDKNSRSLLFLHPSAKAAGYFLLLDQVTGTGTSTVKTIFHPNTLATTGIKTIADTAEYEAPIDGYAPSAEKVGLTIFYGTKPKSVRKTKGIVAGFKGSFEGSALVAEYSRSGGVSNSLTVFYPHNATHPKSKLERIVQGNLKGVKVTSSGGAIDFAFAGEGKLGETFERRSFKGPLVFYRNAPTGFYFLRKGSQFFDSTNQVGFLSVKPVSIHVEDAFGAIVSPGTEVTLFHPGIIGARLGATDAVILESGKGMLRINVPAGTWQLRLVTESSANLLRKGGVNGKVDSKSPSRYMRFLDPKSSRFYDLSGKKQPSIYPE